MANPSMVDPRIFESLQTKIDEDAEARDQIRAILQTLERQDRTTQSILSRAHSTPAAHRNLFKTPHELYWLETVGPALSSAEKAIVDEIASIKSLAEIASKSPYYKYVPYRDIRTI